MIPVQKKKNTTKIRKKQKIDPIIVVAIINGIIAITVAIINNINNW
ncbi:MAG: hypothetical protein RR744_10310 [Cellulosilyticaceae bacterium]